MKKHFKILLVALLLAACGVVAFLFFTNRTTEEYVQDEAQEAVLVRVQTVVEEPVEQLIELTGNIEAYRTNHIVPTIPGRIDEIRVEVGSRVRRGQLLVRMDRTNLVQAELQLENAERELGRVTELHKTGSATQQQLDQLTSQVDVLRETVRNLRENTELLSPIDGVVTARFFDAMNIFAGAQPILTVMQLSPVRVMINIPEVHFPRVRAGMNVRVRLDTYPDREFVGRVNIVYPTIDLMSRTFRVEVTIPNADLALRPGMFARVELDFGAVNHVVIPDVAVNRQPGTNTRFVFVIENGVAHRREVQLGRLIGSQFEVISGVESGADVVIAGQSRLLDQTPVRAER
ncbi:MAG: efflux RND transporter periplasmic adaptor subunit [Bacteroidales bacterium]|nr:efflux RND transporter periplasmic adaptor subunit [Bacteroidales bacterium]